MPRAESEYMIPAKEHHKEQKDDKKKHKEKEKDHHKEKDQHHHGSRSQADLHALTEPTTSKDISAQSEYAGTAKRAESTGDATKKGKGVVIATSTASSIGNENKDKTKKDKKEKGKGKKEKHVRLLDSGPSYDDQHETDQHREFRRAVAQASCGAFDFAAKYAQEHPLQFDDDHKKKDKKKKKDN